MEGLVGEDIFSLPLVLPSSGDQAVGLINSEGWQLEVGKDQSVPLVILDSGEFSFQNVDDYPLLLTSNNLSEEEIVGHCDDFDKPNDAGEHNGKGDGSPVSNLVQEIWIKEENKPSGADTIAEMVNDDDVSLTGDENKVSEEDAQYYIEDLVETFIMYKCKLCNFKDTEKPSLSKHIRTMHLKMALKKNQSAEVSGERMVYMCGKCSEPLATFSDCRVHMAQHHKIMMGSKTSVMKNDKQKCDDLLVKLSVSSGDLGDGKAAGDRCQSPQQSSERAITLDLNKERNFKCKVSGCLARFYTEVSLSRHKACHSRDDPKLFLCSYCNTKFNKWTLCANHLWRVHVIDVDLFSCSVCKYKTVTRVKMKTHEKIHSDGKEFMCNECGKMFSQKAQLRNHSVTHIKAANQLPRWYSKKECDQCQKMFANSKTLKKHVQAVHSKLKPYMCQVCGHCSATKGMLQTHLRQHTGEKPFSCPSCTFTTGDHNSLRRHRMRHSGIKPYRCEHCPYSSIQSRSLKHHMSTWHPTKAGLHKCHLCPFTSVSSVAYHSHLATQHSATTAPDSTQQQADNEGMFLDTTTTQLVYHCLDDTDFSATQFTVVDNGGEDEVLEHGGITIPAPQPGDKEMEIPLSDDFMKSTKLKAA